MSILICPRCQGKFESSDLRVLKCPNCKKWLEWDPSQPIEKDDEELESSFALSKDETENLDPATRAIVMASNRTTHALRALAVFFFTSLRTSVIGSSIFGIGLAIGANPNAAGIGIFMAFVGWAVVLIGFIVAVRSGMKELEKSKIIY